MKMMVHIASGTAYCCLQVVPMLNRSAEPDGGVGCSTKVYFFKREEFSSLMKWRWLETDPVPAAALDKLISKFNSGSRFGYTQTWPTVGRGTDGL